MTAEAFRKIALSFPGAFESAHMGHPDFRSSGKIFATLGYPDESWGMVKLNSEQQSNFLRSAPDVFTPCKGAWGERGATNVRLEQATVALLKPALEAAWQNVAAQPTTKKPASHRKLRSRSASSADESAR